ncbi:TetR/AcrR family transcriptional regulator [Alkalihalobacillus sp. CinArs1]|uniref:TetR/AcrR family transcriptional regulator n=1 Tax=Alkalihalobacillus sp. CinArs1 TaxID=2995314 RepID=UPI0022DD1D90|nr:TetR/AcrR family transcriptional regulator [Alkalihalobacillus sp. CinArs1]
MDRDTTDRRILRTKRMLRQALTELMEEKGFEALTVSSLTERADINRGTFYIHYQDKYDLLDKCEDEILKEFERIVREGFPTQQNDYRKLVQTDPLPHILKLVEYLSDNSAFLKTILGPKGDPSFQEKLKDLMKKNLTVLIEQRLSDSPIPTDYLIAYVSSANLGVIQHWLKSGMNESPREIALILSRLTILGPGIEAGLN